MKQTALWRERDELFQSAPGVGTVVSHTLLAHLPELDTLDRRKIALSKTFTKLARLAGINGVTLHSCRHFTATAAIAGGGDVLSVAAVMGHAQPSMTLDVYGGTDADAMAAAMVGVDEALSRALAKHAASQNRAS